MYASPSGKPRPLIGNNGIEPRLTGRQPWLLIAALAAWLLLAGTLAVQYAGGTKPAANCLLSSRELAPAGAGQLGDAAAGDAALSGEAAALSNLPLDSTLELIWQPAKVHGKQQIGCAIRGLHPQWLVQQRTGFGQYSDRKAIPGGNDLVVTTGTHAIVSMRPQLLTQTRPSLGVVRISQQLQCR